MNNCGEDALLEMIKSITESRGSEQLGSRQPGSGDAG
jgi:hypothetical protein